MPPSRNTPLSPKSTYISVATAASISLTLCKKQPRRAQFCAKQKRWWIEMPLFGYGASAAGMVIDQRNPD
jgi:hypothetical protein